MQRLKERTAARRSSMAGAAFAAAAAPPQKLPAPVSRAPPPVGTVPPPLFTEDDDSPPPPTRPPPPQRPAMACQPSAPLRPPPTRNTSVGSASSSAEHTADVSTRQSPPQPTESPERHPGKPVISRRMAPAASPALQGGPAQDSPRTVRLRELVAGPAAAAGLSTDTFMSMEMLAAVFEVCRLQHRPIVVVSPASCCASHMRACRHCYVPQVADSCDCM